MFLYKFSHRFRNKFASFGPTVCQIFHMFLYKFSHRFRNKFASFGPTVCQIFHYRRFFHKFVGLSLMLELPWGLRERRKSVNHFSKPWPSDVRESFSTIASDTMLHYLQGLSRMAGRIVAHSSNRDAAMRFLTWLGRCP